MASVLHPTSGYSEREELWNSVTHGVGAVLSLVGWVVLLVLASFSGDGFLITACALYGLTLVLLYTASTLYHAARSLRLKKIFLILDHCGIYLLIAGSYTPFALGPLRGPLGWTILGVIWGLAIVGIVRTALAGGRGDLWGSLIYLGMGWLCLIAVVPLYRNLPPAGFACLVAGGVLYSLGVAFYLARRLTFHHTIWHLFVLGGSFLQFFAILSVLPPA